MDMLENMRLFVRVVESGGFTAAAQQIDGTTARVSRAVSHLEQHLGVRLLYRTTRHLALTESGKRYFERCQGILYELDFADAEARNTLQRPQGQLSLHCVMGFGQAHVIPAVVQYQKLNPDVSIDLTLSQSMPNLIEEGYDLSLTAVPALADSAYVSQTLGSSYSILVAAPAYLEAHGMPERTTDLASHRCLTICSPNVISSAWQLEGRHDNVRVDIPASPFRVNMPEAMRYALRAGTGIGPLSVYSALEDIRGGELVRVLPQYRLQILNVYAVYPSRRYLDAKVSSFVEYLRETVTPVLVEEALEIERLTR